MAGGNESTYYVALAMSLVSSLAWLAVPVLGLYALYIGFTGGSAGTLAVAAVGALVIGIVFARLERRYQPEGFRD